MTAGGGSATPDAGLRLVAAATVAPETVAPWFAEAWAAMYAPGTLAEDPAPAAWLSGDGAGTEERRVIVVAEAPLGFLAFRRDDGMLVLTALAVSAAARNRGLGSQAVWVLEAELGTRETRALFPASNGYAFYFWLRTGYRPLFLAEHHHDGRNAVCRVIP